MTERLPKECTKCKKEKMCTEFISQKGFELNMCFSCRSASNKSKKRARAPVTNMAEGPRKKRIAKDRPFLVVSVLPEYENMEECLPQIHLVVDDARESSEGYQVNGVIQLRENISTDALQEKSRDFMCALATSDGHEFRAVRGLPKSFLNGRAIFVYKCCQDSAVARRSTLENQKRQSDSQKSYPCGGEIAVTLYETGRVEFSLRHELHHECRPAKKVTPAVLDFIRENSHLRAPHISSLLRQKLNDGQCPEMANISSAQIYYHWAELQKEKYRRATDPVESALLYLQEKGVDVVCKGAEGSTAIGIMTDIFQSVVSSSGFDNYFFVDSTYGTNRQGLELFVVLASVSGEGYPVSYLVLSSGAGAGGKTAALTDWFWQLRQRNIMPDFLFLDKDQAEIAAAMVVWPETKLQLCWWHVKKAVEKRLGSNKPPNYACFDFCAFKSVCLRYNVASPFTEKPSADIPFNLKSSAFCDVDHREKLQEMMAHHFHSHMLIPNNLGEYLLEEEIRAGAFRTMVNFCASKGLTALLVYLFNKWYCDSMWPLWSRSSCNTIPLSRTNIVSESHFNYLKHNPLHHHNRPRVDYLFFILIGQVMNHFSHKLGLRQKQRGHPRWWRDFKKEWEEKFATPPGTDQHFTDTSVWVCSCHSFFLSRFFLCKHLIGLTSEFVQFSNVKRQSQHPFIIVSAQLTERASTIRVASQSVHVSDTAFEVPAQVSGSESTTAAIQQIIQEIQDELIFAAGNAAQLDVLHKTLANFSAYHKSLNNYRDRTTTARTWPDLQSKQFLRNLR